MSEKITVPGLAITPAIPIFRIFDVAKALEFYLDFLGCTLDWEHRFGDDFPLYCQVSRGGLTLHLSEHSGDASPGARIFVPISGIDALHAELCAKEYPFSRPGLETRDWGREVTVVDPFHNRLTFCEQGTQTPTAELTPYLTVHDARSAMEWYAEVLGVKVTFEPIVMPDGRIGHTEMEIAGARFMLADAAPEIHAPAPRHGEGSPVTLHLTVDDIDALARAVRAAGTELDRGPEDSPPAGRVGVFRDPFGHRWFVTAPLG